MKQVFMPPATVAVIIGDVLIVHTILISEESTDPDVIGTLRFYINYNGD